jgi:hypothetical protein
MGFRGFQKTYGVEELILRGGQKWLEYWFGWLWAMRLRFIH